MDDKDKANGTDTFVSYGRIRLPKTISQQVRDAGEPDSSKPTLDLTINSLIASIKLVWQALDLFQRLPLGVITRATKLVGRVLRGN